jgi:hypothetical protein
VTRPTAWSPVGFGNVGTPSAAANENPMTMAAHVIANTLIVEENM